MHKHPGGKPKTGFLGVLSAIRNLARNGLRGAVTSPSEEAVGGPLKRGAADLPAAP
jgi:hypothetical protein